MAASLSMIEIRRMSLGDLPTVNRIFREELPLPDRNLRREMLTRHKAVFVAALYAKVIAFYIVRLEDEGRTVWLDYIAVTKQFQRRGIGAMFLKHIEGISTEAGADKVALSTHSVNENALAFYLKHGYQTTEFFTHDKSVHLAKQLAQARRVSQPSALFGYYTRKRVADLFWIIKSAAVFQVSEVFFTKHVAE